MTMTNHHLRVCVIHLFFLCCSIVHHLHHPFLHHHFLSDMQPGPGSWPPCQPSTIRQPWRKKTWQTFAAKPPSLLPGLPGGPLWCQRRLRRGRRQFAVPHLGVLRLKGKMLPGFPVAAGTAAATIVGDITTAGPCSGGDCFLRTSLPHMIYVTRITTVFNELVSPEFVAYIRLSTMLAFWTVAEQTVQLEEVRTQWEKREVTSARSCLWTSDTCLRS